MTDDEESKEENLAERTLPMENVSPRTRPMAPMRASTPFSISHVKSPPRPNQYVRRVQI